ncbi:MAG: hypothetical protein MUF53_09730, partial [Gemmatimonadaceae bacterium]|nr:hypothetical protein [Gemmatimonadaceae bacterium]
YTAQRFPEARAILDTARRSDPRDGVSALYAGLAAEAQEDWATAKSSYTAYLAVGRSKKAREQVRQRLAFVSRQELTAAAKAAVKGEAELGATAGDPTTVAVPPFRFTGADSTLQPLERGLADLLITDLAQAPRLTVVERDRMQALVDEIRLSQGNRVDESTAVRAGRMLRAGRIVQGGLTQVSAQALQMNAAVVDVSNAAAVGSASTDDQLEQLFEAEKRLAYQVLQTLGIELTPEQRAAIEVRPTRSFAAFLAYSRGLAAEDGGDFSAAALLYREASRLDPGFRQAGQRATQAANAAAGAQVSATSVEAALSTSSEGGVVGGAKIGQIINISTQPPTTTSVTTDQVNTLPSKGATFVSQPATNTGTIGNPTGVGASPQGTAPPANPITNPPPVQTGRVIITIPRP